MQVPGFHTTFKSAFLERGDSILSENQLTVAKISQYTTLQCVTTVNMFLTFNLTVGDRRQYYWKYIINSSLSVLVSCESIIHVDES